METPTNFVLVFVIQGRNKHQAKIIDKRIIPLLEQYVETHRPDNYNTKLPFSKLFDLPKDCPIEIHWIFNQYDDTAPASDVYLFNNEDFGRGKRKKKKTKLSNSSPTSPMMPTLCDSSDIARMCGQAKHTRTFTSTRHTFSDNSCKSSSVSDRNDNIIATCKKTNNTIK